MNVHIEKEGINLFSHVLYMHDTDPDSSRVCARGYYLEALNRKNFTSYSPEDVDAVFTAEGELKIRRNLSNDLTMNPGDLIESLRGQLGPLYRLEDHALSSSKDSGFASHGEKHIRRMQIRMLSLACQMIPGLVEFDGVQKLWKQGPEAPKRRTLVNRLIIEAAFHDAKMILGRSVNDLPCDEMLKTIYPDWNSNLDDFKLITQTINLHSEGVALRSPISSFTTEAAFLCAADKLDMIDDRLPDTAFPNGIDEDRHTRAQFFLPKEPDVVFDTDSQGNSSVVVHIRFSRKDIAMRFQGLWKKNELKKSNFDKLTGPDKKDDVKKVVPSSWREARKNNNTFYRSNYWAETITDTYTNRLALIALCLRQVSINERTFGTSNGLDSVQYIVHDRDTSQIEGTEKLTFRGGEDNFYEFFLFMNYLYEKNKQRTRASFRNGKVPVFPPALLTRASLLRSIERYDWDLKMFDTRREELNVAKMIIDGKSFGKSWVEFFDEELGLH